MDVQRRYRAQMVLHPLQDAPRCLADKRDSKRRSRARESTHLLRVGSKRREDKRGFQLQLLVQPHHSPQQDASTRQVDKGGSWRLYCALQNPLPPQGKPAHPTDIRGCLRYPRSTLLTCNSRERHKRPMESLPYVGPRQNWHDGGKEGYHLRRSYSSNLKRRPQRMTGWQLKHPKETKAPNQGGPIYTKKDCRQSNPSSSDSALQTDNHKTYTTQGDGLQSC